MVEYFLPLLLQHLTWTVIAVDVIFIVCNGEVFRWRVSAVLLLNVSCMSLIPVLTFVLLFCVLVLHLGLIVLLLDLARRILLKSCPFVCLYKDVGTLRL